MLVLVLRHRIQIHPEDLFHNGRHNYQSLVRKQKKGQNIILTYPLEKNYIDVFHMLPRSWRLIFINVIEYIGDYPFYERHL